MNVLKDVKGLPKITADTIAKIKAARTPFYKKPLPTAAIIMGVLALILILSLLTVIYCQAWRAKRREKRAADPVHRFTEVLRNHDNIEEILGLLESKAAGNRSISYKFIVPKCKIYTNSISISIGLSKL